MGSSSRRRYVQPVNVGLVPAWRQLAPSFRSPAFNTVRGVHYGVTVLWTPNELLFQRRQRRSRRRCPWRAVYDDRFRGKVSVPDNPMQIADAALYLKATSPSSRIRDPYELTPRQFDAAVALLRRQSPLVTRYWQYATRADPRLPHRRRPSSARAGPTRRRCSTARASARPASAFRARERPPGPTAGCSERRRSIRTAPTCWLRYVLVGRTYRPRRRCCCANRRSIPGACPLMEATREGIVRGVLRRRRPAALLQRLAFWKTPAARCGFGGRTDCVPYKRVAAAWANVVG